MTEKENWRENKEECRCRNCKPELYDENDFRIAGNEAEEIQEEIECRGR